MNKSLKHQITLLVLTLALGVTIMLGVGHAVEVQEAAIRDVVIQHVEAAAKKNKLTEHGEVLNVDVLSVPRAPFEFRDTEELTEITLTTNSSLDMFFSSRALVRVKMTSATSGRVRQIGVPVKISLSKEVWVAKNTVMPGTTLRPADFEKDRREITTSFDKVVGTEVDITQYATRMMVQRGHMLANYQMVRPPAVRRNSEVKIVMAGRNGLKLTLDGKSMEDGQIGQLVRVRNRYNRNKYYTGRVIAENRVQVKM